MLDFPNSPSIGQTFPSPPVTGVPIFTWDGVKWIAAGAAATVVASDTPPVGVPADTLWWESDTGLMYVRYNDGNSTQWVIACPQPDISTFVNKAGDTMTGPLVLAADPAAALGAATKQYVDTRIRYDAAQTLADAQTAQARTNIFAAPFDALAYNGMQINGQFDVSQELGLGNGTTGGYACDGWRLQRAATAVTNCSAYNAPQFIPGFQNILVATVQTAEATMAAGDFVFMSCEIEGYRMARLNWGTANAQPLTIAFWSAHVLPGLYTGSIRNVDSSRSYAFSYTQATASVPQYNVITIPGDTAGTWNVTNGKGMDICFAHACGATVTAPSLNNWLAGNYVAGPGQVNGVASTANNFRITGVMALPGIEAPSAARAPFIMRPYDQELTLCKRYLNYFYSGGRIGYSVSYDCMPVFWPAMRTIPTTTVLAVTYNSNCFGLAIDSTTPSGGRLLVQISGQGSFDYNQVNIKLDARL